MSNISFTEITDGSSIDASDVNGPLNTIYDDYNGSIDSNNLADNAVTTAKITDANVTYEKLLSTIFSGAITTDSGKNYLNLGGVKVCWGITSGSTITSGGDKAMSVTLPTTYTSATSYNTFIIPSCSGKFRNWLFANVDTQTTTTITGFIHNSGSGTSGTVYGMWFTWGV